MDDVFMLLLWISAMAILMCSAAAIVFIGRLLWLLVCYIRFRITGQYNEIFEDLK